MNSGTSIFNNPSVDFGTFARKMISKICPRRFLRQSFCRQLRAKSHFWKYTSELPGEQKRFGGQKSSENADSIVRNRRSRFFIPRIARQVPADLAKNGRPGRPSGRGRGGGSKRSFFGEVFHQQVALVCTFQRHTG